MAIVVDSISPFAPSALENRGTAEAPYLLQQALYRWYGAPLYQVSWKNQIRNLNNVILRFVIFFIGWR